MNDPQTLVPGEQRIDVARSGQRLDLHPAPWRRRAWVHWLLLIGDIAVLGAAMFATRLVGEEPPASDLFKLAALIGGPVAAVYIAGGYRLDDIRRPSTPAFAAGLALGVGLLGWAVAKTLWFKGLIPLVDPAGITGVACLLLGHGLWVLLGRTRVQRWCWRQEAGARVVLLGPGRAIAEVAAWYAGERRWHPLDAVASDAPGEGQVGLDQLPRLMGVPLACVVVAEPFDRLPAAVQSDLVHTRLGGIQVLTLSDWIEAWWERTPVRFGDASWLLHGEMLGSARSPWTAGMKRLGDVALALALLAMLWPVMLLTALAVRLTSRGPVLFSQVRLGAMKQCFTIHKFRTMRTDAEAGGARWAAKDDPRVTPIGGFLRKSRLDELPQLWNVLRGDMSFVGPRPERPEFTGMLEERVPYYDLRHLVKPGLTGWAQVMYPYGASVEDAVAKLEYEIFYIRHCSLWFDLRVVLRTLTVVFGLRGR